MDRQTVDILNNIKTAITHQHIERSASFSVESFIDVAQKHKIITLAYYGMRANGVSLSDELEQSLYQFVLNEVLLNEQQLYYIRKISEEFNANGIDHMFLKGSVLKQLYPQPEIRRMGDIDILIKLEQYTAVSQAMERLGFVFLEETNHEIRWAKNGVLIELHKILMPSYNKDLHGYFGDGWKRAILCVGHAYTFCDEDMFIYLFSHFAKHYRDAGIGIIHMCDLYLYMKNKQLDFDYILRELKKLYLDEFYQNVKDTLAVWFEEKESTQMTDYITAVILNSGVYGVRENGIVSAALKEKKKINNNVLAKAHRIWQKAFPRYSDMKRRYRILRKLPVLLPLFWVIRFMDFVFCRREELSRNLDHICSVTEEQIKEYEDALNYVGLDYHF